MSYAKLPCPFCGGAGQLQEPNEFGKRWMRCLSCAAEGPWGKADSTALAAWNRRATPATDRDAVLEEAVAACEPLLEHHVARLCIEAIRALKSTPAPITPSAVDEAERRGAERATAQVVADLDLLAEANAQAARERDMAVPDLYARTSRYCRDLASRYRDGRHIPPATESEAGRG